MLKGVKIVLFLSLLILSGCLSSGEKIKWENYNEGMEKAQKEGKPVMLYFFCEHCLACQLMEKYIFSNESIMRKAKEFICIRVNMEKDYKIVEMYNIRDFPTVIFLINDKEIDRIEGYYPNAKEFLDKMNKALQIFIEMLKYIA